jgi:hypothetical protein
MDERTIVPRLEERLAEGQQEHPLDELMHQSAAPAVCQQNVWIVHDGDGATGGEI